MALKTNTKKTTTVKKVSAPKTKKRTTSGATNRLSTTTRTSSARSEIEELARIVKEAELARAKDNKETNGKIDQLTKNVDRLTKNVDRLTVNVDKMSDEVDKVTKRVDSVTARIDRVTGWVGGIRNTIGNIVEMVLLPGLADKINKYGHAFTRSSHRNEFFRKDKTRLAEVDLLLQNGQEVMVVEAKTLFDANGVDWLLKRVQRLRSEETLTGVAGKTIYAAAAGVRFTEEAEQMIKEKGIYQVTVNEENDKIIVAPLDIEDAGTW